MINLLDFKDRRIINICKALTIGQISISVENIMKLNNCSKRTVYNDLDEIETRWQHLVNLQSQENMFYFETQSIGNLQRITRDITSQAPAINLLYRILLESHQPIEHYALSINVSVSSVTKLIRDMNKVLSEFDITIKKDNGYYLHHDNEDDLRYLITEMILDGYSPYDIMNDPDELRDATDFIKVLAAEFNYFIGDVPALMLAVLLRISILRERQGFRVERKSVSTNNSLYDDIIDTFNYEKREDILGGIETLYSLVFNNVEYERLFPIVSKYILIFVEQNNLVIDDRDTHTLINIGVFTAIFNKAVKYHYEPIINRPNVYGQLFMKQNKEVYINMVKTIHQAVDDFNIKLPNLVNELIFIIYLDIPHIAIKKPLNILVMSDYGFNHASILIHDIQKHFSEHTFIPISFWHREERDLNSIIYDNNIDLVISTSSPYTKIAVDYVIINDFLNGIDIKNIYNKIYLNM